MSLEMIDVAQRIEEKIEELKAARGKLEFLAKDKAAKKRDYAKALARTIMELYVGVPFKIAAHEYNKVPSTVLSKVAEGNIADKEGYEMELATELYKVAVECTEAIKAELNGYQSINRYLKEV